MSNLNKNFYTIMKYSLGGHPIDFEEVFRNTGLQGYNDPMFFTKGTLDAIFVPYKEKGFVPDFGEILEYLSTLGDLGILGSNIKYLPKIQGELKRRKLSGYFNSNSYLTIGILINKMLDSIAFQDINKSIVIYFKKLVGNSEKYNPFAKDSIKYYLNMIEQEMLTEYGTYQAILGSDCIGFIELMVDKLGSVYNSLELREIILKCHTHDNSVLSPGNNSLNKSIMNKSFEEIISEIDNF